MNSIKEIILKIFLFLLIVVLAAGLFLFGRFVTENQRQQAAQREAIIQEAKPYEEELHRLKADLSRKREAAAYSSERAEFMIGFLVSDPDDLSYIERKAGEYGFPPVVVLDCTADPEIIAACVEASDAQWELMLYAPSYSTKINASVVSVQRQLEELGRADTGVFLLRRDYNTESNIRMLMENGFIGYSTYHTAPASGQMENGCIFFDYAYVRSDDTLVTDRITQCVSNRASMFTMLDMQNIRQKTMSERAVNDILRSTQELCQREDCTFTTVAEVTAELSQINQIEAQQWAEYEEYAASLQNRIDELERTLREIYAEWNPDEKKR